MLESDQESQRRTIREGVIVVAALLALVSGMIYWWRYPYPSGRSPDFIDFLLIWGREALLVLMFGGALIVVVCVLIWRVMHRMLIAVVTRFRQP